MAFDLLGWLAEPKSERIRQGTAFGCFGAAAMGVPLLIGLLAFAAIPHCKKCGAKTGSHLIAGLALAILFGLVTGTLAAAARTSLQRAIGKAGSAVLLILCIAAAAYLSLNPAVALITG